MIGRALLLLAMVGIYKMVQRTLAYTGRATIAFG